MASTALKKIPPWVRLRNLAIIAHVDHGKSTLADRLLERTGTIKTLQQNAQVLDRLKVERERGITVKANTVSMHYRDHLVTLVDTPGHVDFSYEVSRSLAACEGVLLLVDASQGIQAQTISHHQQARALGLKVLPVLNKVDLGHARVQEVQDEVRAAFFRDEKNVEILGISAKSGLGVDAVLPAILAGIPPPRESDANASLQALLFDSSWDQFLGVILLVKIMRGTLRTGDRIALASGDKRYEVSSVGILNPDRVATDSLTPGMVGYVICGMRVSREAQIGDTLYRIGEKVDRLPGFREPKSMVFAGVYPLDALEYPHLEESIERLTLNDRSVRVQKETSGALGQGFRLGFLGTLHLNVFRQRLEDEHGSQTVVTHPNVTYRAVYRDGRSIEFNSPGDFPESDLNKRVCTVQEPMIKATIVCPEQYIGSMLELCSDRRGTLMSYNVIQDRVHLQYRLSLGEIARSDFFSELKSQSSGYASFDYEEAGWDDSDLARLTIAINGSPVDPLSQVVHRSKVEYEARKWTTKLKTIVPRQLYEVKIQAVVGSKVLASERVAPFRKDVTAKLYGGDRTRKDKLLKKQKAGKKRMLLTGSIQFDKTAFNEILSK